MRSLVVQLWVSAVLPCALSLLHAGTFPSFSPSLAVSSLNMGREEHGCGVAGEAADGWRAIEAPIARAALVLWSCPGLAV